MLVHGDKDFGVLKDAEGELQQQVGRVPDAAFYERKLQAVWTRAQHSSHYAGIGPYSFTAFQQLPLTAKAALKSQPLAFCTVALGDAAKYYATTGTTGEPTPTPRLKHDIIWNAVSVASHWRAVLQPGARVANLMPSDIVPVGDLIANVCEYLDVSHVRLYPFTTGITDWERVCTTFDTYRPTVLFIAPGVLVQLTRYLKQRELLDTFAQSVRTIMLLGEVNTQPFRDRLARGWHCEVHDASYGSTETGTLAAVGADQQMRLATATNYFELLLPDGRLVTPAEGLTGRLVVTPLNLYARPLLRLDTGDSVTLTAPWQAGQSSPSLLVNGRDSDSIAVAGVDLEIRAVEEVVYGACDATGYVIEIDRQNDSAALILERDVHWDNAQEGPLQAQLLARSEQLMGLRWSRVLFVNNLSAINKSGGSQKSWKKTNLRFVGASNDHVTLAQGHGLGNGQPDLWCTYAAIRSLAWVERLDSVDTPALHSYIQSRRNRDGGFAWSKGMPSDAWATFYCTETLKDLGIAIDHGAQTADWLQTLFDGDAYAMCPGQTADVWATHYAVRTLIEVCQGQVADAPALYAWLEGLQCSNGGLSWSADFAQRNLADTRACFYGVMAARALAQQGLPAPRWDLPRLIAWLQAQQVESGGFRFSEAAEQPCLWATYRATASLAALHAQPLARHACIAWIDALRRPSGAFVRWQGYDGEDVWAAFCAVGSLKALGEPVAHLADDIARFIATLALPQGGYTYRQIDSAADVLTTAAAVLGDQLSAAQRAAALHWIEGCQMPNEPGLMYMPGRGAEVRCTNWGLAAGAFAGQPAARKAVGHWLASLQNPDGGFGFWEGRGSDLVSTASAVAILQQLGNNAGVDLVALEAFVASCAQQGGHAAYPRGQASLRASLQALICLNHVGWDVREQANELLVAHKVRQGGFANLGQRIPDLLSTYQAVAFGAAQGLPVDRAHLQFFLDKVRSGQGHAWSPLYLEGHDALSDCLGRLLQAFAEGRRQHLPNLQLS